MSDKCILSEWMNEYGSGTQLCVGEYSEEKADKFLTSNIL